MALVGQASGVLVPPLAVGARVVHRMSVCAARRGAWQLSAVASGVPFERAVAPVDAKERDSIEQLHEWARTAVVIDAVARSDDDQ